MVDTVGKSQNRTAVGVRHLAICCPWQSRKSVLSDVVQVYSGAHGRTMIFTQTKRDANDLALDDVMKLVSDGVLHFGGFYFQAFWFLYIFFLYSCRGFCHSYLS